MGVVMKLHPHAYVMLIGVFVLVIISILAVLTFRSTTPQAARPASELPENIPDRARAIIEKTRQIQETDDKERRKELIDELKMIANQSEATPTGTDTSMCMADINDDGLVDLQDYIVLVNTYFTVVEPDTEGDVDGDGFVDLRDYIVFVNQYGMQCS